MIWRAQQAKPNGEPYSEESVKGWWRPLRALPRWAVDELDLAADPTSRFDPKRYLHRNLRRGVQAEKGTNALTPDELGRFLAKAKEQYPQHYAMMVVGFFTGMRWSELSALRWEHFKAETKEIEIRTTQWRQKVRERPKAGRARTAAFDDSSGACCRSIASR